jgi:hypothetical protein
MAIDESCGHAFMDLGRGPGYTAYLHVNYKAPLPAGIPTLITVTPTKMEVNCGSCPALHTAAVPPILAHVTRFPRSWPTPPTPTPEFKTVLMPRVRHAGPQGVSCGVAHGRYGQVSSIPTQRARAIQHKIKMAAIRVGRREFSSGECLYVMPRATSPRARAEPGEVSA